MAGPWEKYQQAPAAQPEVQAPVQEEGPWTKFAQPQTQAPAPDRREELHARQIQAESGGNQAAVSPKGATGRMQVMPATGPEAAALAGLEWDPQRFKSDGQYNEALGRAYQDEMLRKFNGNESLAFAAYNAGPGRVNKAIQRYGDPSKGQIDFDSFIQHLPKETQDYVRKIVGNVDEGQRVVRSGVKQGAGAIPTMASQGLKSVSDWGSYAADKVGIPSIPGLRDLPSPTDLLGEGVDYLFKPREEEVPETPEGKMASRVLGSTVAGVMAPGAVVPNLLAGLGAGLGAEAGAEIGGAMGHPQAGAIVGGVAGSLTPAGASKLGHMVGTPIKTAGKIASQGMANVTPEMQAAAQLKMVEARKLGVNLTFEQALDPETNIRELTNRLTQMQAGEPLAAQYRNQAGEIERASEKVIGNLPGQIQGQQQIANQSQQAADTALRNLRQDRTNAVAPYYADAGSIDPADATNLLSGIRDAVRGKGTLDRSKTLTKLYNKLNPVKTVVDASGNEVKKRIPVTDVQTIDDTLRELEKKMSNKPKDPRAQALIQSEIGKIRDQLKELSPGYAEGSETYAQITRDVINPAKQGPLGTVAQKTGYDPSNPASRTNLYGLFDRGEGVLTLQKDMAKAGQSGKDAFADAGTSWFADKVRGAARLEGGQLTPDLAANIEKGLYGSPAQVKRTNEILAGIARAKGVEESTLVNGMRNWAQTVAAAAKTPTSTKGLSAAELIESTKTAAGKTSNISLITPFRGTLRKIDSYINQTAYSDVAKLLQTPEGVDVLRKLAATKPGSEASKNLIAKFSATMAAQQAAQEKE